MRKSKFRGLNITGRWYCGNLAITTTNFNGVEAGTYISNSFGRPFAYQVVPSTVGQFIGVSDINKNEIYEGDIILYFYEDNEYKSPIIFDDGCFMYKAAEFDMDWSVIHKEIVKLRDINVIGNIHQAPELLS